MPKKIDKNTRYFLDLDLEHRTILKLDYDDRFKLEQTLSNPFHHRIFLTKGQYGKLEKHLAEL
ncbi:MAG: hypothetical protein IT569_04045 [Leptospiraceae bacterium]|nr:hypothetical protein [Leptospiraceae bacterium]